MTPQGKNRKRMFLLLLAFCGLALAAQEVVEEVVAIVNDDVITLSEYRKIYESRVQTARQQLRGEELDKVLEQIKTGLLDEMITRLILLQMAKERNLNVSENVKMALENIKKENGIESDDDLKRAVMSQGYDYDAWLKQFEENVLQQAVVASEINKSIALDEAEIIEYYKSHPGEFVLPAESKARAVYLSLEGRTETELEARKAEVLDQIKAGTDFAQVAETYCDPPLKEVKGDLGTIKKGEMDKTLEDALAPLKKGELSAWVLTKNGWYLFKVEDFKDSRSLTFDEAKRSIEQKLFTQRQVAKQEEFLRDIKVKGYVKILKSNPLADIK